MCINLQTLLLSKRDIMAEISEQRAVTVREDYRGGCLHDDMRLTPVLSAETLSFLSRSHQWHSAFLNKVYLIVRCFLRWIQLLLMLGQSESALTFHASAWAGVRKDVKPGSWCCGPATRRLLWLHDKGGRFWVEGGSVHVQTQQTNWCHISCQYSKVFFSTPTEGSSLFNIMKPQREPAGLCSSIWRRHQLLQGCTLDPSNWLWQQHETDKWETPPEWPDDWGRNEETCSESQSSVGKVKLSFDVLSIFKSGFRVTCANASVLVFALGYSCHSTIAVIAFSSFALISISSLHPFWVVPDD